jgi:orotate phosphoribosyltransferase
MPTDLLSLLSARDGHFRLVSGHHGSLWFDLETLFARQSRIRPFVFDLANKLSRYSVEAVCGPLVGGAFLAQLLASALDVEFTYTERFLGLQGNIQTVVNYRLPSGFKERLQGKPVAIVDDVINAGSAVRSTYITLRSCGAVPLVVGALLVLGSSAAQVLDEYNLPLESAATLPNEVWIPKDCPLCAEGVPLEDMGNA